MSEATIKQLLKKYGYCIEILDRSNGLVTLTLKYGIDLDYSKEFSGKVEYKQLLSEALIWAMDNNPTDLSVYFFKQILKD